MRDWGQKEQCDQAQGIKKKKESETEAITINEIKGRMNIAAKVKESMKIANARPQPNKTLRAKSKRQW